LNEEYSDEEDVSSFPEIQTDSIQDDLVFGVGSRKSLRSLHPQPANMSTLWVAFTENVNPLNKIIHVPSAQKIVVDAISDLDGISKPSNALLFAFWFAGVASLQESECLSLLGESKKSLLVKYRYATQKALLAANYLRSLDLCVLQAFVIYLVSVFLLLRMLTDLLARCSSIL
jgi:hypothetical protein